MLANLAQHLLNFMITKIILNYNNWTFDGEIPAMEHVFIVVQNSAVDGHKN